ncbi:hypothetical protein BGZ74_003746, partial [Mortierella antarctica]
MNLPFGLDLGIDFDNLPPNAGLIAATILIVVAIIIGAVLAPCVLMGIVTAIGFTANGILVGSKAAIIMACYGGYVT